MNGWIPLVCWIVVAQSPAAPSGDEAARALQVQSVWDFVVKGGPIMIPIGLCSLVALGVFIERTVSLRRGQVIPSGFVSGLKEVLNNGSRGRDQALDYCQRDGSPAANIFAAAMKKLDQPAEVIEKHVQEAGEREIVKLRKFLRVLSVIASIAPLLGLLGTIFGMIEAFQTVAASGEALGKTELLAKGIYEALITTAAGLVVTIPVLIAYHWLSARIDRLVYDMDRMVVDFLDEYHGARRPAAEPARRPEPLAIPEGTVLDGDAKRETSRLGTPAVVAT